MHGTDDERRLSWLCLNAADRERVLDMDRRLGPARRIAFAILGVGLLASGPWVGWWTVAVLAAAALMYRLIEGPIAMSKQPEWWIAGGWLVSLGAIAASVAVTGGADSPAVAWLLVPAIVLPARFSGRGLWAGVVLTVVALAAVTIGVEPHAVADKPQLFIFPLALIGASIALTMALRSAEIEHRSEAVLDQLTGLLNRKALEQRVRELELQSRVNRQPIGLIVCDIDHFKAINDTHGHAAGDAVLTDIAYRLRKGLRAYDLAYRLGGEEFVVLVPGASRVTTVELAERLRAAVAEEWVEDIAVTMSFGVASSGEEGLDFKRVFGEADEALYRAKAGGRNRVCTADDTAFVPVSA